MSDGLQGDTDMMTEIVSGEEVWEVVEYDDDRGVLKIKPTKMSEHMGAVLKYCFTCGALDPA